MGTERPATIEIPFGIGETVWAIGNGHREDWIECPECAGTKVLTLTKGNGEQIEVQCGYCQIGCDPPRGIVVKTVFESAPEPFTCRRLVRVDGKKYTYSESDPSALCYTSRSSENLFRDYEECAKACAERNTENARNQERQMMAALESKRHDLAHSSHYWTSTFRALERDIELVKARIKVCRPALVKKEVRDGD